ncbi:MAG: transcription termination factor NusA [Calditrichaeota bacterium]|nr:transcription termination factor NusA [Calditrichota bacterium]RQV92584.1 MAG: transcription termination factor NusA [bacterium]RQW07582.1 MAG: transcription termination factor NusA [Calditrichota bacterium]
MRSDIVEAVNLIAREKRIDKDELRDILEDIFLTLIKRKYGDSDHFDVIVNMDRGDVEIFVEKEVAEEVEDPILQISLKDAKKTDPEIELGETFVEVVQPDQFGRRLINIAKQTLLQRIREYEKRKIYDEYSSRVGEIIIGDVHQVTRNGFFLLVDRTEMFMPRSESIPREELRRGDSVRALIKKVIEPDNNDLVETDEDNFRKRKNRSTPDIIVSRADNQFLIRLFEIEVPEIFDGIVEIKKIARKPGERAKISVESMDKRIDPVGACVGMRGVRIQSVVRELNGEKIDVIAHSNEPEIFIQRALTPAKAIRIILNEEENLAVGIIPDKDMGLALGRGETNKELAQKMTGWNIELIKESEYYQKSMEDEIDVSEIPGITPAIQKKLKDANINTAEELKSLGLQGLIEIPGIGQKTAQKILQLLNI